MTIRSATTSRFLAASLAAAASLSGVACSSANTTPTSSEYDDVAQSTAALVTTSGGGGELGSMSDSASLALGVTPLDVTVNASGTFDGSHAGLSYNFALSCTSANGTALAHCGPTTNDADASVSWSGVLILPDITANVLRTGSWTVTGVQTGTATFNGTGSFTVTSTFASAFRNESASTSLSYAATYSGITYAMPLHQATAGSAHYTIHSARAGSSTSGSSDADFTIDAVLTFAPGGTATLVLDGSHTYSVSATGVVIKI
jgi:hypothetical protein